MSRRGKMKKILLLLCLLSLHIDIVSNIKPRAVKKSMTTSVIVPCVARHFFWLSGMLENYQNQTVRPDEIVVVFSEVEKINDADITRLQNGVWNFDLKIIKRTGVFLEGENRNVAMDNAKGDILIFSDADDIPHPQRVEIVKYFFENYEVEHIIHCFAFKREDIGMIDITNIHPLQFASHQQVWNFSSSNPSTPTTFGSPCFLKEVGARVKWSGKNDVPFNQTVYQLFQNKIVLPVPLILYRSHLSSHAYRACVENLE